MMQVNFVMEDIVFNAVEVGLAPEGFIEKPEDEKPIYWSVTCTDIPTGKVATGKWTYKQVAAVLTISYGGVDAANLISIHETYDLYKIVEPLIESWPRECRPIP